MNIVIISLSLALSLLTGYLFVSCFMPNEKNDYRKFLFICGISLPVGIGLSSVIYFLCFIYGFTIWNEIIIEIVFLFCLLLFLFIKKQHPFVIPSFKIFLKTKIEKFLFIIFLISILISSVNIIFRISEMPHGAWDAFGNWNLKAKFLMTGNENWKSGFSAEMRSTHPDYPLMQPSYIARWFSLVKTESHFIPALFSLISFAEIIFLLTVSVALFKNKIFGLLCGIALTGTPFLIERVGFQQADLLIALLFLSAVCLLAYYDTFEIKNNSILILTGCILGFSGWAKNEGLLFIAVVLTARMMINFQNEWKIYFNELKKIILGMTPVLLLIFYFKSSIAPPNEITSSWEKDTIIMLSDFNRYIIVMTEMIKSFLNFGNWIVTVFPLLFLFALITGVEIKNNKNILSGWLTYLLMVTGYFFIYITTPNDLQWHISTSVNRLFMQVYPMFLFYYFLSLKNKF